jgi:hypothetical protein
MKNVYLILFLLCESALYAGSPSLQARSILFANDGYSQSSLTSTLSNKRNLAITLGILGVGVVSWACWRWGGWALKKMGWLKPKKDPNYVSNINGKLSFDVAFNGEQVHYTEDDIVRTIEIHNHPMSMPIAFFRKNRTIMKGIGDYTYGFAAVFPDKDYMFAQRMGNGAIECWLMTLESKEKVRLNVDAEAWMAKLCSKFVNQGKLIDTNHKKTYSPDDVDPKTVSVFDKQRMIYQGYSKDGKISFHASPMNVAIADKASGAGLAGATRRDKDVVLFWHAAMEHMYKIKTPFIFDPETFLM